MKLLYKYYLIIIIISFLLLLLLLLTQKIDSHLFDTKYNVDIRDAQGLECLGDKNELFIISSLEGGTLFKFNPFTKVTGFQNTDRNYQEGINFMAHPTSLIKKGNTGIIVNSTMRMDPYITSYNFKKNMELGVLSDEVIINSFQLKDYRGLHIELINYGDDEYLLLENTKLDVKKKSRSGYVAQKSHPTFEFLRIKNSPLFNGIKDPKTFNPICEMSAPNKIQNMFWDKDNSILFLSRNLFGSRGSRIDQVKFNNLDNLNSGICPSYIITKSTIFLTYHELEGYSKCGDSEYFIYNHPIGLYERKNTK